MQDAEPLSAPAWFGKIACLGDFASRRLPQEIVQVLDIWLARCVEASRGQLGLGWTDAYLTGPLWRFVLAPDVLDARWWFGVLMPSVDNVGRYFPLLLMCPSNHAPDDAAGLDQLDRWFTHVAHAALGTLQQGGSLVQLEAELAQAPRLPPRSSVVIGHAEPLPARIRRELGSGVTVGQCMQRLALVDGMHRVRGYSLWSPMRPVSSPGSLSATAGLPAAESFVHLLDGTW